MAQYLLAQKEGPFLLSERFNQDPLESFFGQQRARGGRSDNHNVVTFLHNAQAFCVQRTMVKGHGGNVRKRKEQWKTDITDPSRPLKERPRKCIQFYVIFLFDVPSIHHYPKRATRSELPEASYPKRATRSKLL